MRMRKIELLEDVDGEEGDAKAVTSDEDENEAAIIPDRMSYEDTTMCSSARSTMPCVHVRSSFTSVRTLEVKEVGGQAIASSTIVEVSRLRPVNWTRSIWPDCSSAHLNS